MSHKLDIRNIHGLTQNQVKEQVKKFGYNELPSAERRNIVRIILDVVTEPMFLLLVACGSIYFFSGKVDEAAMLLGFVFVIMGITIVQERKAEHALEALRDLSCPRALVIRDGQPQRIPGREVVVGDMIVLCEGDRIPADALVMSAISLSVDESLLTGEAVPVRKMETDQELRPTAPGGEDLPFVYSGTLVVQGQGIAKVLSIGLETEIGKIGKAIKAVPCEATNIQKETGRLVRTLAIVGLLCCVVVVIAYGLNSGNWLEGILAGITLAMAMLPEEFPVVLTIFLALGAWRISQKNVLTRRIPAVETLGSATVLCVDKTGTLTQNQMTIARLFAGSEFLDVTNAQNTLREMPENFHELIEFGTLASQKTPFDPMEKALRELCSRYLSSTEHWHEDWNLVQEYPLSKRLLAVSHVWQSPDGQDYVIAAKGAPEAIFDLCHLSKEQEQELANKTTLMAQDGLRVLGVAKSHFQKASLPIEQHDFVFEFLGLVGLHDPVRPSVPAAIQECYQAGIRVVMITGDYPKTAQNIAKQIGLSNLETVITGPELLKYTPDELAQRVKSTNIFARVVPEQKLLLVNALKQAGEIVAMTGDGVNDAPALKAAHIGIAMGERGTDVARESAALVLLKDDFSYIVEAVKMGRRIFDNLQKAMSYILAVHVPIAGMTLIPALLGWELVLLPVHVVFLELVIDPACSVVFEAEPEEKNVMRRPPRNPQSPLFGTKQILLSLLQGLSVLIIVLGIFCISRWIGHPDSPKNLDANARALTFTTLIIANLGLIMSNRSLTKSLWIMLRSYNAALWWVVGGALGFLGLVLYVPFLRNLFSFQALHLTDLLICLGAGIISILWFEIFKWLRYRQE